MATKTGSERRGDCTVQYKAVNQYRSKLLGRLQLALPEIVDDLFTDGLISSHELAYANGSRLAHNTAAADIMEIIMTKIKSNIKWYYVLIQVLKKSSLSDIGEEIEDRAWSEENEHFPSEENEQFSFEEFSASPSLLKKNLPNKGISAMEKGVLNDTLDSAFHDEQDSSQSDSNITSVAALSQVSSVEKPSSSDDKHTNELKTFQNTCGDDILPSSVTPTTPFGSVTAVAEEAVDSASNGRSKIETGHTADVLDLEYKKKMALLQREKEGLEADLENLNKIRDEEKMVMKDQTVKLTQFQEDVDKMENTIKNLKEDQDRKNEEIKKLRSEKAELEERIKELSIFFETEQKKKAEQLKHQFQETVDTMTEKLKKAEMDKIKALEELQTLKEKLEEVKKREKEALHKVEESEIKVAHLQLEREREKGQYMAVKQKLESDITIASLTTEKLLANKDKELAETNAELYKLKAQCAEEREKAMKKCAQEREEELRREIEALKMKK